MSSVQLLSWIVDVGKNECLTIYFTVGDLGRIVVIGSKINFIGNWNVKNERNYN